MSLASCIENVILNDDIVKRTLVLGVTSFLSQISLVAAMAAINNMIRKYDAMDEIFGQEQDPDKRTSAIAHLYGVSLAATMIAKKRGLDPEIASMAAMLHDLHAYKTGSYDDHAHKGAECPNRR